MLRGICCPLTISLHKLRELNTEALPFDASGAIVYILQLRHAKGAALHVSLISRRPDLGGDSKMTANGSIASGLF